MNQNLKKVGYKELEEFVTGALKKAGLDEYLLMAVSTGLPETSP